MPMLSVLVSSTVLAAAGVVVVNPSVVPARGEQEATLKLERAGMVRLGTKSERGVSCAIVDHLRGPFAFSGSTGRSDCGADLLLDPGAYRLRLSGPTKGKGSAKLSATAFQETNASTVRLDAGKMAEQKLASGQQASFWIHMEARGYVVLRARGRTAGAVHLWRDGEWRENLSAHGGRVSPVSGQPIYDWRIESWLEKGNYLFTVYGTEPLRWTQGAESEELFVSNGFPELPATGTVSANLPATGTITYAVPLDSMVAIADLDQAASGATELSLFAVDKQGVVSLDQPSARCRIEARALVPTCSVRSNSPARHVLEVRGVPGTKVRLRTARFSTSSEPYRLAGSELEYSSPRDTLDFRVAANGAYDVELKDVPTDADAAPLSCMLLESLTGRDAVVLARDYWQVDAVRTVERSFNYNGSHEVLGFELAAGRDLAVSTSGQRKSKCELYRVDGKARRRVGAPSADGRTCLVEASLTAGTYELHLNSGNSGIETVRFGTVGRTADKAAPDSTPAKVGCRFANVQLRSDAKYRVAASRVGKVVARGLAARRAGSRTSELAWEPPSGSLPSFSPRLLPLPRLETGAAAFFDFDRGETRSLTFEVTEAGLYSLTTDGLLATTCRLRTPAMPELASDTGGGRGRNCMVEAYLRPGRYLATATTVGQSRGRAGIRLLRRPPAPGPEITVGHQVSFRVPAGELIRQPLTVGTGGPMVLETHAPGATLSCRLEDKDGWPIFKVPSVCSFSTKLDAGRYVWIQLPLTVESQRQVRLERPRKPRILTGSRPHPIAFNTPYTVKLDRSGKDEFLIDLKVPLDVRFEIDHEMQGRLFRIETDGKPQTLIDVISPKSSRPTESEQGEDGEGGEGGDGEGRESAEGAEGGVVESEEPSVSESDGEGGGEPEPDGEGQGEGEGEAQPEGDGDGGEVEPPKPRRRAAPVVPAIHLEAGYYRLVTQHLQGDSHIAYNLQVTAEDLAPGMARDIEVPFRSRLRIGEPGVLRLRTEGQTDVRCRIFRAGELVFESAGVGEDWNCGLAEPIAAGEYELVVESEALAPGPSRVFVDMPAVRKSPTLASPAPGGTLRVDTKPLEIELPAAAAGTLQAVAATSKQPFALALLDSRGRTIERRTGVRDGSFVLNPGGERHRLLLWTLRAAVQVTVGLSTRAISDLPPNGAVQAHAAARVTIPRPGHYSVGRDLLCAPAAETGVLRPCGPEASLEAGPTLFARLTTHGGGAPLSIVERPVTASSPWTVTMDLGRRPFLETQKSAYTAVHLMAARVASGAAGSPSCSFTAGIRALFESGCAAASDAALEGTARVSVESPAAVVEVTRASVPLPGRTQNLAPGTTTVTTTARLGLPAGPWQVEVVLPPDTWAVQLAPWGKALDFCPPEKELSTCLFSSESAGEILLWSRMGAQKADIRMIAGLAHSRVRLAGGLLETTPREPGWLRVPVPASPEVRLLEVSGATACAIRDAAGTRYPGCQARLPAGMAFEVAVEAGRTPLRVATHAEGVSSRDAALFPSPLPPDAAPLEPGQALALSGPLVTRRFTLRETAVLSLRADSGVCGFFSGKNVRGAEGMGAGCSMSRVLEPGEYRLAVRSFGDRPLFGAAALSRRPVVDIVEGVGEERTIAPDEMLLFRFQMKATGQLGLGLAVPSETLECAVLDGQHRQIGVGCQQLLQLERGTYLLSVSAPHGARPARFRPVIFGTNGVETGVPDEYLEDLRSRIGATD